LEVSDDTKCEPSHKSEVVDQLQADNYGKGKSSFVRISVVQWLKISTEWVMKHQESSKRMEEENPKIETNYLMPKENFISYTFTGGHDPHAAF
jgi:hypothetical protein